MLVFGMKLTYRNQEVTSLCIIICRSLGWRRLWIVYQQPESVNQPAIESIERTHNKWLHLAPKRFVLMSQVSLNYYMDISKFKNIIWGLLSALSWVTYGWSISMYYSNDEKGWALSIWCVVIFSIVTFGFTFLLSVRNSKNKALYVIISLFPWILIFPTALLISG